MKKVKVLLAILWATLFCFIVSFYMQSQIPFEDVPSALQSWLEQFGVVNGGVLYIFLYIVRPLIFFPATLLTVTSGLVFGPVLGVLFTIVGENASANLAFVLSRWFGRSWVASHEHGILSKWEVKLKENALVTVLIMRLVYLPFDAVNYGCGLTSMRQRDFFIGTSIGIIPGLLSFVLLGGAVSAGTNERLLILGSALLFFLSGLVIARKLKPYNEKK